MSTPAEDRRGFIDRLESLRGVAAMMVAVGHCAAVFPAAGLNLLVVKGLITVFNGRAAVTIFFVLSGFVLGLSLRRSREPFLPGSRLFILRRVFRIYPALMVSSLAILTCLFWLYQEQISASTTPWFQAIYRAQPGWREFLGNLVLRDFSINEVTWSLRVELIGSALLPVFHALSQRMSWRGKVILFAGLLGLAWLLQARRTGLFFMFMFYLGYLLPEVGPPLCSWLTRRNAARMVVLLAVALGLGSRWHYASPFLSYLVEGLAAAVFIAALLYGPELWPYRALDSRWARFYGRISYSFYLLHFCVMYGLGVAVVSHLPPALFANYGLWSGFGLAVVSVAVATPLSWASYQWVERPGIELGKRVGARLLMKTRADR